MPPNTNGLGYWIRGGQILLPWTVGKVQGTRGLGYWMRNHGILYPAAIQAPNAYGVATFAASSSASSAVATVLRPVAIGDLVVLGCIGNAAATAFNSTTDSKGNTWLAGPVTTAGTGTERTAMFFTVATKALVAGDTITLNSAGNRFAAFDVVGFTNNAFPATASVEDQSTTGADAQSGTALSIGPTGTTANAQEVAVAAWGSSIAPPWSFTAGLGWTPSPDGIQSTTNTVRSVAMEYQFLTATGTVTPNGSMSASSDWQGVVATFKIGAASTYQALVMVI